jgi:hypothetical protein
MQINVCFAADMVCLRAEVPELASSADAAAQRIRFGTSRAGRCLSRQRRRGHEEETA